MAYLDSADCAQRVLNRLNRPTTDTAFTRSSTNDVLYEFMTEAQDAVTKLIATFIPDAMELAPTALTTADSGKTYTFGTDADSANIFPLGWCSIYEQRTDIPDFPLEPGVDFDWEGAKIRIPNNTTRTFADGGPWAQFVSPSNVVSAATQPSIPKLCRLAMVERTAELCIARLGLDRGEFESEFDKRWLEVLGAVRTQAMSKYSAPQRRWPQWQYWGRR